MNPQRVFKRVRFPGGRTMPWPEVLRDFDCFVSVNPEYQPMRRLVYDVHACVGAELHATQTMGGNLLLSPEPELHRDDNVLLVSYAPKEERFHLEHRTISHNNDSKDAPATEVWAALRLFVGYKFGIRLPEARPSKAAGGDGGHTPS